MDFVFEISSTRIEIGAHPCVIQTVPTGRLFWVPHDTFDGQPITDLEQSFSSFIVLVIELELVLDLFLSSLGSLLVHLMSVGQPVSTGSDGASPYHSLHNATS